MLAKLQKIAKIKGISYVAFGLGYRSETTVAKWFSNGAIPKLAEEKVREFLKNHK